MRTTLVFGLAVLLIAFVIATVVVNRLTTDAIEENTANALGVPASLEDANVNLLTGSFTLSELHVENSEGFEAARVMRLGRGEGRIRLTTFVDEVVEMPSLTLSDLELHLERRGGTGNYEPILAHYIREGRDMGDPDRRYVIDELRVRSIVVHLDLFPDAGEAARTSVPIDELRLIGVGEEEAGVMLQEIVGVVAQALFEAALRQAAEELPGIVEQELTDRLGDLPDLERLLP